MKNRKIVFYVTRQYMKKNRKRTMTTLLGIMLMVVMLTCVFVGKDTALSYLVQVAELNSGSWHMRVYDVNQEQYEEINKLEYMEQTGISYDIGFSECKESKNTDKPYWELKAYATPCFDWMKIEVEKGRLPKNENEVIISQNAMKDGAKLEIGDTIAVSAFTRSIKGINPKVESTEFPLYGTSVRYDQTVQVSQDFPFFAKNKDFKELHTKTGFSNTYTIVGIMEAPTYETEGGSFYAALTYTPNQMGDRNKVNVTCRLDQTYDLSEGQYMSDIQNITDYVMGAYEVNDLLLAFSAQSSDSNMNAIVNFIVCFFLGLILVVSMILIYNVFHISYEERCRYLGMLSSVGATKQQKRSSVYYEAVALLLFALPVGILLGLSVVKAGMQVLRPYIFQLEGSLLSEKMSQAAVHLVITPKNMFFVIAASVVTVLISAMIPARKIGKVGAIESIRGTEETKKKPYRSRQYLLKKGKPEILLAVNVLQRQKGKAKGIVRAVAAFLVVLTVTSFGASAIIKMVRYRLVEDVAIREHMDDYDYCLAEGMADDRESEKKQKAAYEKIKQEIQKDPSVEETKEWYTGMFVAEFSGNMLNESYWDAYQAIVEEYYGKKMTRQEFEEKQFGGGPTWESLNVLAVDADTFTEIAKNCGVDPKVLEQAECPGIFYQDIQMSTDTLIFDSKEPKHYRMFELKEICEKRLGDVFPVSIYNPKTEEQEEFSFTLAGYADSEDVEKYVSFQGEHIWMITRADVAQKMNRITADSNNISSEEAGGLKRELYIKFSHANCLLAQKLNEIGKRETSETDFILSKPGKEFAETFSEALNYMIKVIAICFVVFTGFICLLNLYNSIRERAMMRKREMAMLRSVGMEERQMFKMLFLENLGMWMRGVIWSAVLSFPMVYGIGKVLKRYFGQITLPFPWTIYVSAFVLTFLVLLFLTRVCYHGKENENLLEQMRMEHE